MNIVNEGLGHYVSGNRGEFLTFIRNNNTGKMIYFPVTPTGISEGISANFTQQDIIGASRPRIVYSSTGAKTMTLSLQNLTEDYISEGFNDLLSFVRALQALAYPVYSDGGLVKAPDLTLVLGDRSMSCVCTSVSVSWGELVRNQRHKSANVDLTLLMTRPSIPGAVQIENNG